MGEVVWYSDDEIEIKFSDVPELKVQIVMPWHTEEQAKEIYKKPFICEKDLKVIIKDKVNQETFDFYIEEGYTWDGASIPRMFWRLIGSKSDNRFLVPSLIHDVLCENHDYIDDERYLSTIIFERLLYVSKVNPLARWTIKHSVDNYQKVFGGW